MRELLGGEHAHGQGNDRHESEVRASVTLVCASGIRGAWVSSDEFATFQRVFFLFFFSPFWWGRSGLARVGCDRGIHFS